MTMKLCPKCGCLSYFNSYFQKWMCNTCEHQFKEQDEGEFTQQQINRQLNMPRLKPEFGAIKWDVKA